MFLPGLEPHNDVYLVISEKSSVFSRKKALCFLEKVNLLLVSETTSISSSA